uniref:Uncharacterized protein n=1 Tax=Arundo donax TaxID=35708 RepID=A0A0A9CRK6_ARUDO
MTQNFLARYCTCNGAVDSAHVLSRPLLPPRPFWHAPRLPKACSRSRRERSPGSSCSCPTCSLTTQPTTTEDCRFSA